MEMSKLKSFNLLLLVLCILAWESCQSEASKNAKTSEQVVQSQIDTTGDEAAIHAAIHGFYTRYDERSNKMPGWASDFLDDRGKHLKLDPAKLENYFSALRSSGYISAAFIENERDLLKKCEQAWQNESKDEPGTCLDADRFFCAQDWDVEFWTKGKARISSPGQGETKAAMNILHFARYRLYLAFDQFINPPFVFLLQQ
jgi:hypothetical protein